ncbi:DUF7575 domain-containing protein [Halorubrum sp. DTA98]|uniref:DUF7575 domain-containing protein n=1 Tax=Halorubrum sp. DTA98 TaxID=3402163 RepID=UPI003AB0898E
MGDVRRRRPWLAVLLALVISGLGHAYLRRWGRALGWYVAITATLVFLVPDGAVDQLFAGTAPPLSEIAPALVVIVASVVDAYVLAVRNNRRYERQTAAATTSSSIGSGRTEDAERAALDDRAATEDDASRTGEPSAVANCPSCGREVDPELDFCHWCTEELPRSDDVADR